MGNCVGVRLFGELEEAKQDQSTGQVENQVEELKQTHSMARPQDRVRKRSDLTVAAKRRLSRLNISSRTFIRRRQNQAEEDYVLGELLGQGAYGDVYKVKCRRSGQTRALKRIHKVRAVDVLAEPNILTQLDHPCIIRMFDIYQSQDYVEVVEEFADGGDLFESLKKVRQFSEEKARQILLSLLSAVSYLHQKGIVHRDIKPQNIVIQDVNHLSRIKLIDFGTSQVIKEGQKLRTRTGTYLYMAPEVLKACYDEKCDLWSCGVVFYILLTGNPPFKSYCSTQLTFLIQYKDPSFEGKAWEQVSEEAKDLLKKMLCRDPKSRLSARAALRHPWLQTVCTRKISQEGVRLLQRFSNQSLLIKILRNFILFRSDISKQRVEIYERFRNADKNGDGVISKGEFQRFMDEYEPADIQRIFGCTAEVLFNNIDLDKNGSIEFSEFVSAFHNADVMNEDFLGQAFELLDANGDGQISREELDRIVGGQVDPLVWKDLLKDHRFKSPDSINREQFFQLFKAQANPA